MQFAAALETAPTVHALVARALRMSDRVEQARTLLGSLMAQADLLAAIPLARKAGGYERTFLFGDETVSVWVLTWAAGARTPIHDHHCSCCFGILDGELTERWFTAVGDGRAAQTREAVRHPGFEACMVPTGPNIHQMINTTDREAVSVHVYGFDRTRRASSIEQEYELAAG